MTKCCRGVPPWAPKSIRRLRRLNRLEETLLQRVLDFVVLTNQVILWNKKAESCLRSNYTGCAPGAPCNLRNLRIAWGAHRGTPLQSVHLNSKASSARHEIAQQFYLGPGVAHLQQFSCRRLLRLSPRSSKEKKQCSKEDHPVTSRQLKGRQD